VGALEVRCVLEQELRSCGCEVALTREHVWLGRRPGRAIHRQAWTAAVLAAASAMEHARRAAYKLSKTPHPPPRSVRADVVRAAARVRLHTACVAAAEFGDFKPAAIGAATPAGVPFIWALQPGRERRVVLRPGALGRTTGAGASAVAGGSAAAARSSAGAS
jgi:hypothetical protein